MLPSSGGTLCMLLLLKSRLASFGSLPKPLTSISVICNTKCERILRGNRSSISKTRDRTRICCTDKGRVCYIQWYGIRFWGQGEIQGGFMGNGPLQTVIFHIAKKVLRNFPHEKDNRMNQMPPKSSSGSAPACRNSIQ